MMNNQRQAEDRYQFNSKFKADKIKNEVAHDRTPSFRKNQDFKQSNQFNCKVPQQSRVQNYEIEEDIEDSSPENYDHNQPANRVSPFDDLHKPTKNRCTVADRLRKQAQKHFREQTWHPR